MSIKITTEQSIAEYWLETSIQMNPFFELEEVIRPVNNDDEGIESPIPLIFLCKLIYTILSTMEANSLYNTFGPNY